MDPRYRRYVISWSGQMQSTLSSAVGQSPSPLFFLIISRFGLISQLKPLFFPFLLFIPPHLFLFAGVLRRLPRFRVYARGRSSFCSSSSSSTPPAVAGDAAWPLLFAWPAVGCLSLCSPLASEMSTARGFCLNLVAGPRGEAADRGVAVVEPSDGAPFLKGEQSERSASVALVMISPTIGIQ